MVKAEGVMAVATRLRTSRKMCARVYRTDLPTDGRSVVVCSYIVQFIWSLFILRTMWNENECDWTFSVRTFLWVMCRMPMM